MWKYVRQGVLSALLAASLCHADEGRIPIVGPVTINAPGHYIVTRDFSYPSGNGILIRSNNVTLDLNGFTITGPACTGAGETPRALSFGTDASSRDASASSH